MLFLHIKCLEKLRTTTKVYMKIREILMESSATLGKLDLMLNLTLRLDADSVDPLKELILPEKLDHLTLVFPKSYSKIVMESHEVMAKKVE